MNMSLKSWERNSLGEAFTIARQELEAQIALESKENLIGNCERNIKIKSSEFNN